MGDLEKDDKSLPYTLFPVKQANGIISYYCSDFSEELGHQVYMGYPCSLVQPMASDLIPTRIEKEKLVINKEEPVAIKIYDGEQRPSGYQYYDASEIAVLTIENRDVLIMEYIKGFHIAPELKSDSPIKQLSFFQAVDLAWQLIQGLNHLHYNNLSGLPIVHGDITGNNIKIREQELLIAGKQIRKLDALYLDFDFAKRITDTYQIPQGTPEHLALEVLDGVYSEASDFFALSPLLLSLFGARNPFKDIIEFRNNHDSMKKTELIKKFRDIPFCTEGLFSHFDKKPDPGVLVLLERFIIQMGAKERRNRPLSDAVLEFFTALRQLCLTSPSDNDCEVYLLRLHIAAQSESWLTKTPFFARFLTLEENIQDRLIALMNSSISLLVYQRALAHNAAPSLIERLRNNLADHLSEKSRLLKAPSKLKSIFFSSVTQSELQWLVHCYKHNEYEMFHAPTNEKLKSKLLECKELSIAPFISALVEGIKKPPQATLFMP
ncbi:protein kinase domain-containing protein [Legionella saoudiensis]|uniref:protein kinase domain-containing protein n=1 Tax=Legionella saoudiensis TaxID=1750561 RepID=UPI0007312843|nr:protein kinase [Legionella saoudiensis]